MRTHWRNKLEGSVILPTKAGKEPNPPDVISFRLQAPCHRGERICFLDNTDCWLGAQGPVPALLLGTLPPQGCSLLPSCGFTTQDAILTIPYPHEARTRSLLPSAPGTERLPFGTNAFERCCSMHSQEGRGRRNAAWCPVVALRTTFSLGWLLPSQPSCTSPSSDLPR